MPFVFCNSNDKEYQRGLNVLLTRVFQDFSFWYDLNLWDERYESHAIVEDGKFVSNICVFKTQVLWHGEPRLALSFGAVCTDPEYRGRGYSRALMDRVLARYPGTPMYLSANDGVLGFYPRFGFRRVREKLPVFDCVIDNRLEPRKLAYDDPKAAAYPRDRKVFSARLDCLNSDNVAQFYIHQGKYKECLFEIPECETMLAAEREGEKLKVHGVFSLRPVKWGELLPRLPFSGVRRVEFGFAPDALGIPFRWEEFEGEPLFVRGVDCDLGEFKFPDMYFT